MPGWNGIPDEPMQRPAAWCGVWMMTLVMAGVIDAGEPAEELDPAFLAYLASYEDETANWTDVAVPIDAARHRNSEEAAAREAADEVR